MMTEEQARKCWCPFARVVEVLDDDSSEPVQGFPVGNRNLYQTPHPNARCLGSRCMAWRFTSKSAWQFRDGKIIETHVEPDSYHNRGGNWIKRGYCGLAGAPE